MSRIVSENRAEQGHGEADAADDSVFPGSLKRRFATVKHDQEDRGQCRSFDGYPEDSKVVGESDQDHGEDEQRRKRVVLAQFVDGQATAHLCFFLEGSVSFILAEIADGIDGTYERHESSQQNDQRTESVGVKESIPKRNRSTPKYLKAQRSSQAEQNGESREIDHLHEEPPSKQEGQRAGGQRNDKESEENHRIAYSRNFRSLLTSMESNVSRIRKTRMPRTMTATRTSKRMPSSTTNGTPYVKEIAARNRPFSSESNPRTCVNALRRFTIAKKPIRKSAMATASVLCPSAARAEVSSGW